MDCQAGTWSGVSTDNFTRANSAAPGNNWSDPDGVGGISSNALTLTVPTGGTGTDIRVSRPVSETGLSQRIEATFTMPATNDGLSHGVYLRGKSLVIDGREVFPVIMVCARHAGSIQMFLRYKGGAVAYPYIPGGTAAFTPVAGHSYTLAAQITNNFPSAFVSTLTDNTASTQVASLAYSDYSGYGGSTIHMTTDFKTAGVMGVTMEGGAGKSVSFTKVDTFAWTETGPLAAPPSPGYSQHDGKTYLASPFPSGGTGPYSIRWYRGGNNFTPPTTIDGSGSGTGTYIGNSFEQVDANPPAGVSNWSLSYRAVCFDSVSPTGVLSPVINTNSPTAKSHAVPFWIGDSITYGYATSTNGWNKSPTAYTEAFLNTDATISAACTMPISGSASNYGIPGITSAGMVANIPFLIGKSRLIGATFVGIMLGTNDSKNSVATPAAQYQSNIQAIVAALKSVRPDMRIVLNKPIWFKPDTGYGSDFSTASLSRLSQYNSMLDQLADGTNIVVGGLTASNEIQGCGWSGTTGASNAANATTAYPPAPAGGKSYLVDGLHPYDGGAEMMAKLEWGPNAKKALLGNYTPVTFDSWLTTNKLSGADALPGADPDGNGIGNMAEYALGIPHGTMTPAGLPTMAAVGGNLSLSYQALQADITYLPEWSLDLISWNTTGFTTSMTGNSTTAAIPIGANSRIFLRLRLSKPL